MKLQTATVSLEKAPITKTLKPGEIFNFKNIGVGFCQVCLDIDAGQNPPADAQIRISGYGFSGAPSAKTIYGFVNEDVPFGGLPVATENFFCNNVSATNISPVNVNVTINSPYDHGVHVMFIGPINLDANITTQSSTLLYHAEPNSFAKGDVANLFCALGFFGIPISQNPNIEQPLFAFKVLASDGHAYEFEQGVPYYLEYPVASLMVRVTNAAGLQGNVYTIAALQQGSGY